MIHIGDKLTYETGRKYDGKQTLTCEVIDVIVDAAFSQTLFSDDIYSVKFVDPSRHLQGVVKTCDFSGESVLELYDSGQYALV